MSRGTQSGTLTAAAVPAILPGAACFEIRGQDDSLREQIADCAFRLCSARTCTARQLYSGIPERCAVT